MGLYYAVPVRRENRTLFYNPFDGICALAPTPMDAMVQLGMPEAGSMIAVWPLTRKASLEEVGHACSLMAPLRIFIVVGQEEGVIFPLGLDPALDAVMEVPDGRGD